MTGRLERMERSGRNDGVRQQRIVSVPPTSSCPAAGVRNCSKSQAGRSGVVGLPYCRCNYHASSRNEAIWCCLCRWTAPILCGICFHSGSCACGNVLLRGGSLAAARWLCMACDWYCGTSPAHRGGRRNMPEISDRQMYFFIAIEMVRGIFWLWLRQRIHLSYGCSVTDFTLVSYFVLIEEELDLWLSVC